MPVDGGGKLVLQCFQLVNQLQRFLRRQRIGFDCSKRFFESVCLRGPLGHAHREQRQVADLGKRLMTFAAFVESLDEATLGSTVSFPPQAGGPKSRFEMLLGPKEHEMHHRGQLMLIQRMN